MAGAIKHLLTKNRLSRIIIIFLITCIFILNINFTYNFVPNGLSDYTQNRDFMIQTRINLDKIFNSEDILVTQGFTYFYFPPNFENVIVISDKYHMDVPEVYNKVNQDFEELIGKLENTNRDIFIITNSNRDNQSIINDLNKKFKIVPEKELNGGIRIYRIGNQ